MKLLALCAPFAERDCFKPVETMFLCSIKFRFCGHDFHCIYYDNIKYRDDFSEVERNNELSHQFFQVTFELLQRFICT
jgi:hypothetical protein